MCVSKLKEFLMNTAEIEAKTDEMGVAFLLY
jgi:hypothetical protein